jgi:general secretion pathway protein C
MEIKQKEKRAANKIPFRVEKRIVELSLQHPDHSGRRLVPLLEQEGIQVTASAVHAILKRNYLLTKSKRLAMLDSLRSAKTSSEPASTAPSEAGQQDHVSAHSTVAHSEISSPKPIKTLKKSNPRPPWALSVPNLILLGIIGYFWSSATGNFLQARHDQPILSTKSEVVQTTPKSEVSVRPLEDYNIIAERNLFGGSAGETPAPEEMVSLEDIPAAEKTIGLKLVGTVAGDDSAKRFAIIENNSTRKQELYHEEDKAGEVLIKRILRNQVIVDAGRGEELLALELEETGKKLDFSPSPKSTERRSPPPQGTERSSKSTTRHKYLQLDRKEVEASIANIDGLIQQVKLTPYSLGTQNGFMITKIPADSIFTKIGLRSGDVIRSINDQPITGPEDASAFLQKVREGGDVEITLSRRRRKTQISLKIE